MKIEKIKKLLLFSSILIRSNSSENQTIENQNDDTTEFQLVESEYEYEEYEVYDFVPTNTNEVVPENQIEIFNLEKGEYEIYEDKKVVESETNEIKKYEIEEIVPEEYMTLKEIGDFGEHTIFEIQENRKKEPKKSIFNEILRRFV